MKNSKITHIVFIIIFLASIYLPLIGTWLPILPPNTNFENRKLSTLPALPASSQELLSLSKDYEAYFSDNFGGRNLLFDINMAIQTELSTKPFKDNKLIIGNDGWYFNNFQKAVDDYRAVRPFTVTQLSAIEQELLNTKDQLKKKGIDYYLMVVPNKHTVYAEYLPDYIQKVGEKTRFEQLIPFLKSGKINFIDIRQAMTQEKSAYPLYFKTDSHWNLNGSFIGYQQLMKKLSKDYPQLQALDRSDFKIYQKSKPGGDIVKMLGKENEITDSFYHYDPLIKTSYHSAELGDYKQPEPKIFHPESTVSAFDGGATSLRAVIFQDSYGGYLQQFLNNHFDRIVYIWGHDYDLNEGIVLTEKPQIVIQVVVERYLYSLLEASEVSDQ